MDDMIPGFSARYDGRGPHYETWYGKVDMEAERALWFRYTTLVGADGRGLRRASCWAVLFDGTRQIAGKHTFPVSELAAPNTFVTADNTQDNTQQGRFLGHRQVFHAGDDIHLDAANAVGRAGKIRWDLRWDDRGRRLSYMPHILDDLGLVTSTYDDCLADLRVRGKVWCGSQSFDIDGATGMVGHIQGKRVMGHRWAWSHCNHFDGDADAAFEGLSVKARVAGRVTPTLSAFVVWVDGRRYTFREPANLLLSTSEYDRDRWAFHTRRGGVRLSGVARAPDEVALVEYTDTDGSHLWCHNSKLGELELHIEDPAFGLDRTLRSSGRAAFEYVSRDRPLEAPLM